MVMVYATQCLSGMAMLNGIFNIQAQAGLPSGRACQLFGNLKHKYNPHDKLLRVQMIKKLNKTKANKEKIQK